MRKFIVATIFALTLGSCKSNLTPQQEPYKIKDIVKGENVTFLDVRIPEQYEESTVPGAINIPLAELEKSLDQLTNKGNIVVFCNRGIQADQAMDVLKKNGVKNVYDGTTYKNVNAILNEK